MHLEMLEHSTQKARTPLQALTREDLDRRLRRIAYIVTRPDGLDRGTAGLRWITAAELVRRVRPFLSCN